MSLTNDMMSVYGEHTKYGRKPEITRHVDEATTHSMDAYWEYTSGSVQLAYNLIVQAKEKLEMAQRLIEDTEPLEVNE